MLAALRLSYIVGRKKVYHGTYVSSDLEKKAMGQPQKNGFVIGGLGLDFRIHISPFW